MSKVLNQINRNSVSGRTWNGAVSNSTTGFSKYSSCLDYWSKAGTYLDRDQSVVDADMVSIFSDDEKMALAIVFSLRLITRKPKNVDKIKEIQTGYGRKDEFYKAVNWLVNNKPDLLYRNLDLIPIFGSWKDLFQENMLKVLDKTKTFQLVLNNIEDDLLRKYLPQIRSKNKIRSERDRLRVEWAKGFCKFAKISSKNYREIKSKGLAHIFQKQMSSNEWDAINFNGIPGRAMLNLMSRQGKDNKSAFERHNQLERFEKWLSTQKTVKFTGYPYELTKKISYGASKIKQMLFNKQFASVLEAYKGHNLGNVLCAVDTSSSMGCEVAPNVSAYDVCVSMGLAFSSLNVGYFQNTIVAFDNHSSLIKLEGDFFDKLQKIKSMTTAWGSTNFQSIIDLLVQTRQTNPEIPVSEYPETLLVLSDMQFNPTQGNAETNYQIAMNKLKIVGLGEVRIIWWFLNGTTTDFPSLADDKGVYMIGGFDPVNLKSLMGLSAKNKDFVASEKKEQTPLDGMMNFFSQPIFGLIQ